MRRVPPLCTVNASNCISCTVAFNCISFRYFRLSYTAIVLFSNYMVLIERERRWENSELYVYVSVI